MTQSLVTAHDIRNYTALPVQPTCSTVSREKEEEEEEDLNVTICGFRWGQGGKNEAKGLIDGFSTFNARLNARMMKSG